MKQVAGFINIVLLVFAASSVWAAPLSLPKGLILLPPRPAPALKLKDMDDNAYDLRVAQGRWKFVHFWASWCGPCRREMPSIQRMLERMQGSSLEIVLINVAESEDTVFSFLASVAPDVNSLLDTDGLVTEQWQPRGLPSTYLVDPQGNIRYVAIGGRPWETKEYIDFLHALLAHSDK
ncbi:MAG: TlpA family protein disulfide reductase [Gammaproteobacteria bacterium]|nr:TlpA family protein disulfide reductase [Gammaproteobacteria bacterium]